jgi:hypothetical protein
VMELLGSLSLDQLHNYTWVTAAGVLILFGVIWWRNIHWTVVGSLMFFAALNAGAGIYVLSTVGDFRWSAEAESSLTAPSFAETPVVGEYLLPLDSALQDVVGGVNDFIAFKQALPIALNFLTMSGLALLVAFALAFIAVIISMIIARNRNAELTKYRANVDQLKADLERVKWQISTGSIGRPAFEPAEDDTEVLPRRTR